MREPVLLELVDRAVQLLDNESIPSFESAEALIGFFN